MLVFYAEGGAVWAGVGLVTQSFLSNKHLLGMRDEKRRLAYHMTSSKVRQDDMIFRSVVRTPFCMCYMFFIIILLNSAH